MDMVFLCVMTLAFGYLLRMGVEMIEHEWRNYQEAKERNFEANW